MLSPNSNKIPENLESALTENFGDIDILKNVCDAGMTQFGSGAVG